ncbi:hypothetical protein C7M84_021152 [Penaeus vannamei]|uniref:Uncharacterized protein n=1 Tax=Penaeus vannamei TaxID=6689 RepID=A0A3R7NL22_PENVA|nr:hypothetical protein C7M84_021152 [Penaeus vannamei]
MSTQLAQLSVLLSHPPPSSIHLGFRTLSPLNLQLTSLHISPSPWLLYPSPLHNQPPLSTTHLILLPPKHPLSHTFPLAPPINLPLHITSLRASLSLPSTPLPPPHPPLPFPRANPSSMLLRLHSSSPQLHILASLPPPFTPTPSDSFPPTPLLSHSLTSITPFEILRFPTPSHSLSPPSPKSRPFSRFPDSPPSPHSHSSLPTPNSILPHSHSLLPSLSPQFQPTSTSCYHPPFLQILSHTYHTLLSLPLPPIPSPIPYSPPFHHLLSFIPLSPTSPTPPTTLLPLPYPLPLHSPPLSPPKSPTSHTLSSSSPPSPTHSLIASLLPSPPPPLPQLLELQFHSFLQFSPLIYLSRLLTHLVFLLKSCHSSLHYSLFLSLFLLCHCNLPFPLSLSRHCIFSPPPAFSCSLCYAPKNSSPTPFLGDCHSSLSSALLYFLFFSSPIVTRPVPLPLYLLFPAPLHLYLCFYISYLSCSYFSSLLPPLLLSLLPRSLHSPSSSPSLLFLFPLVGSISLHRVSSPHPFLLVSLSTSSLSLSDRFSFILSHPILFSLCPSLSSLLVTSSSFPPPT